MEISTDSIKKLREMTSVSVMQCRKALEEADGDLAKAEVILKKHSAGAAEKKAERELKAGVIGTYVHDGGIGAMVLLLCETDFVAKNPEFATVAREIAMQVAATDPKYLTKEEIAPDAKEAATAVFEKEVEGKPAEMKEKILEGKLANYFRDQVLLEQPYIKDEAKTIHDILNEATQKFGERVEISRFARFSAR
ncbi:elongation factor Ts [Candidatus Kaiserbacteria bacterium CG10_big_fil_rev_8_21_14_0_10_56_12]|uniref:Elongation factor Ts n=1 Tax=Candidatus Kaiserbacteria bacterium CG10_big_fil_rev_8_21_14_0_10_56_12 TaxID=1974611 RepID=A0A2H0UAP8_9BACT|nr:MAG: elongation factor Ts [Candidatus Kaiserbacteria bacterium CG10_big_fil_rev_8_21_14_0_10_56_12]